MTGQNYNELLEAALDYARRGWRVVPLHNLTEAGECTCEAWRRERNMPHCPTPAKHPRFRGFVEKATTDEAQIRKWWATWPFANVAIILGKETGMWVFDTDPRNGGTDSRDDLVYHHGQFPYTLMARSGGGGAHEYFKWPDFDLPAAMQLDADKYPGIDIIGEGHVVVAPPSQHPSGRRYEWEPELGPDEIQPVDAPAWLLDELRRRLTAKPVEADAAKLPGHGDFPPANYAAIEGGCGWIKDCADHAATLTEPEWYAQLSVVARCRDAERLAHELSSPHPGYRQADTAAKLRRALSDTGPATCSTIQSKFGGRWCASCAHFKKIKSPILIGRPASECPPVEDPSPDLVARWASKSKPPASGDPRQHRDRFSTAAADEAPAEAVNSPERGALGRAPANERVVDGCDAWRDKLLRKSSGAILPVLANAITALRHSPDWHDVLCFDEFSFVAVAKKPAPFGSTSSSAWSDHEDRLTADWLQHHGILVGVEVAGQAVQAAARDRCFHPVRDYLDSLTWDGTKRIDGWLSCYLGVVPTSYSGAVGERWLRSAVARVQKPGCKADCALIAEGSQGKGKSTAFRALSYPWFADEIAEMGSKDAALQTRGVWILEMSELDALSRSEVGRIKSFMSRSMDRFRPPYGRHLIESPRQCVFAGSVNHASYLRDETGARRFWPVACTGSIRIQELSRDRDQLWAEAFASYRAGQVWWLDSAELVNDAEEEQSGRYEECAWDSVIMSWACRQLESGETSISVSEVLESCLKKRLGDWTTADSMRVGRCLTRAKWQRFHQRSGSVQQWRYRPPAGFGHSMVGTSQSGTNAKGGSDAMC